MLEEENRKWLALKERGSEVGMLTVQQTAAAQQWCCSGLLQSLFFVFSIHQARARQIAETCLWRSGSRHAPDHTHAMKRTRQCVTVCIPGLFLLPFCAAAPVAAPP